MQYAVSTVCRCSCHKSSVLFATSEIQNKRSKLAESCKKCVESFRLPSWRALPLTKSTTMKSFHNNTKAKKGYFTQHKDTIQYKI